MFFSRYFLQVIYTPLMHFKNRNLFFKYFNEIQNLGVDPLSVEGMYLCREGMYTCKTGYFGKQFCF